MPTLPDKVDKTRDPAESHVLAVIESTSEFPLHGIVEQVLEDYKAAGLAIDWLRPEGRTSDLLTATDRATTATLVVVQDPGGPRPSPEASAVVGAARAMDVPMLILAPAAFVDRGRGVEPLQTESTLWPLSDSPYSQVIKYPMQSTAEDGAWEQFEDALRDACSLQDVSAARSGVRAVLRSMSLRIVSRGDLLAASPHAEDLAQLVSHLIHTDVHRIDVQHERLDRPLEITIPARLYPELLSFFRSGPFKVHAIADPANEVLQWGDVDSATELARVSRRTFLLYRRHVQRFGLEPVLGPIQQATSSDQQVWVACVEGDKDRSLLPNDRLFGNNRFWITQGLEGGWADSMGERIKLLSYPSAARNPDYTAEQEIIAAFTQGEAPPDMPDVSIAAVPRDRVSDATELASWLYSSVLDEWRFEAIWAYGKPEYSRYYDSNIVRATPSYFPLLDALASSCRRALLTLATAYSSRAEDTGLRVLELGYGTGTFTQRLSRICRQVDRWVEGPLDIAGRPRVELEGWDSDPHMWQIARRRMYEAPSGFRSVQEDLAQALTPTLRHLEFRERQEARATYSQNARFDLVVGSLFSHYFVDYDSHRGTRETSEGLRRFRDFLLTVSCLLRDSSNRMAQFLDVFFANNENEQEAEMAQWRQAVEAELQLKTDNYAELAERYFKENMEQWLGPAMGAVDRVAGQAGFATFWEQPFPGLPFRILTLTQRDT